MRQLTAEFLEALNQPVVRRAILAYIDHPDGEIYAWDGIGDLEYNGNTYQGVGAVGTLTGAQSRSEIRIGEAKMILSNVPHEGVVGLTNEVRGRTAKAWLALMSKDERVIPDPSLIFQMEMDYQTITLDERGMHTITINGVLGFWAMDRASNIAWSREEQIKTYPTDVGFDLMHELEDKEVAWTNT